MPVLYFIRHGETDWNRAGRLQGRTDTELNARGRKQAAAAARHLAGLIGRGEGGRLAALPFHASPMIRTRQTIELLRAELGLDPAAYRPDDRLREVGFGAWEGKTWAEIRARDPIRARDRDADRWSFAPPGGESYSTVMERVRDWLSIVREDACIVSHGGIARVILVALAGADPAEAVTADIWQGKILMIRDGKAEWRPGPGHH